MKGFSPTTGGETKSPGKKRRAYRGGRKVTEQYCKHPSKGFERGRCCMDDASAQDLANVRQAFLSDKRLIVTNFHVIHSGERQW